MLLPQRTGRSLGMMVAAIVAVAALSLWAQRHSEDTRDRTAHSLSVLLALEEVQSLIQDAETNARGYLLSDEPAYLSQYGVARSRVMPRVAQLEELTRDDLAQHPRAVMLQSLAALELD